MRKINLAEIEEVERRSPKGNYHAAVKQVSVELGRERYSMDLLKRHPFDLTLVRLMPGAALCPYHAHSAQWELYVVVSGQGTARDEKGTHPVVAGDAFLFRPGEAHQLRNDSTEDLVYYVIADNPVGESCYYPDSGKWGVEKGPAWVVVKGQEADYFEGEE